MLRCVILTGLPGSGKTTCGALLAEALKLYYCDTDEIIESSQKRTIKQIFDEHGEARFRELEKEVLIQFKAAMDNKDRKSETRLEELARRVLEIVHRARDKGGLIISVGGGVPEPAANREILSSLGTVVYLFASPKEIAGRLKDDGERPLLGGQAERKKDSHDMLTKLNGLLDRRNQAYESADIKIDTSGLKPHQVITRLQEALETQAKI